MKRKPFENAERTFGVLCVGVLILAFISVVGVKFAEWRHDLRWKKVYGGVVLAEPPEIDWAILYPFSEETKVGFRGAPPQKPESWFKKRVNYLKETCETMTSDGLICRRGFVGLSRLYKRGVFWNYAPYTEYNNVVRMKDDYLTGIRPWRNMENNATNVVALAEYCKTTSTQFVYVNAPTKNCQLENDGLSGSIDYSNQNGERLLSRLSDRGVKTLNLHPLMHENGKTHREQFFRSDIHWRLETGLRAAKEIVSFLNTNCGGGFERSYLDDDQFTTEFFPKSYVGSQGKKQGAFCVAPEDFTLLHPKYPTDVQYESPSKGINKRGAFEVLYDMRCMAEDYPYWRDTTFLSGNTPFNRIRNYQISDESRVLVIHDSFGRFVVPFLALTSREIISIDLRFFNGSVRHLIETERPDYVVVLYDSWALVGSPELFDFR